MNPLHKQCLTEYEASPNVCPVGLDPKQVIDADAKLAQARWWCGQALSLRLPGLWQLAARKLRSAQLALEAEGRGEETEPLRDLCISQLRQIIQERKS